MRSIAWIAVMLPLVVQAAEDNGVVTKQFAVNGAPEVVVSIVTGTIRVTSHSRPEVVMTAQVHYEADDAASLAELRNRIRLETEQSGNNVWIGMESDDWNRRSRPRELGWRGKTPSSFSKEGHKWNFRHDIELRVPRTAHLKLSTVNGGGIEVTDVAGEFNLNNVNGGIEVKGADGFGRVHTVNGPISLAFRKNPADSVGIKTINGKVELHFQPGLNADFKIKTFNGQAYSDFTLADRPLTPKVTMTQDGMKKIWSMKGFSGSRAGKGGPEIEIDAFNGNISLYERKN